MKRLLISVFAVAAALFATSCAQDGIDNSAAKGEEAVVTFAVNAPEMATRALFGDGTAANQLYYAVYDEDNKVIDAISVIDNPEAINISTQVKLRLVNGNTYSLIFWAQNADGVATIDWDAQTMTYDPTAMSVEAYDAFWAYVEPFTVNGAMQKNVDLYRPFAQVIIGAADYDDAVAAGLTVAETQITVTTPSAMNLVDGTASAPAEFTYAYAALPTETFPVADHQHMGMTYLLFGADKGMVDIKFNYKDANNEYSRNFPAVPVQRNFRTVIYGNLLTSQAQFNVTIVPEMEDINKYIEEVTTITMNDKYYKTIQEAVDAAQDGDVIKIAEGTYNEVVNVVGGKKITLQAIDENVVVAGFNHQTNSSNYSTVVVEGITFDNSLPTAGWFTGTSPKITPCVGVWGGDFTFNNCKFVVAGTSGRETGVMTWWVVTKTNLAFNECEFVGKNDHANARAMQIYGGVDMQVNDCTFNTKKDYSLKYVADEGNVATFEGNTVNNSENFVELGSSAYPGDKYTVKINNTTLGAGVNPFVVANDENQIIYLDGKLISTYNAAALAAALADASVSEIELAPGVYDGVFYMTSSAKTIKSINPANKAVISGKFVARQDVKFENIAFDYSSKTATSLSTSTYGSKVNGTYAAIVTISNAASTFEGCEFNGLENATGINYFTEAEGKELTVNNCVFKSVAAGKAIYSKTLASITNSTFDLAGGQPWYAWPRATGDEKVVFKNNTILNGAYCAVGFLTQSGIYDNMFVDVQGNNGLTKVFAGVASATFDPESITYAAGSETLNLSAAGKLQ